MVPQHLHKRESDCLQPILADLACVVEFLAVLLTRDLKSMRETLADRIKEASDLRQDEALRQLAALEAFLSKAQTEIARIYVERLHDYQRFNSEVIGSRRKK